MRNLFLDEAKQELYPDWQDAARCLTANLRQSVGTDTSDPRFIEVFGELSLASQDFVELWARHDVKGQSGGVMRFEHPQVGEMSLNRELLAVEGSDGLHLVIHHADPGSASAEKLAVLASATMPAIAAEARNAEVLR